MKKNIKLVRIIIAAVIFIAGLVLGINGYSKRMSDSYADAKSVIKAYKENADSVSAGALKTAEATINSTDMLYAIGLVLVVIGIVIFIAALTAPKDTKNVPIIVLAEAALLAALCYVGAGKGEADPAAAYHVSAGSGDLRDQCSLFCQIPQGENEIHQV